MALFKTKAQPFQAFAGIYSYPIVIASPRFAKYRYVLKLFSDIMNFFVVENFQSLELMCTIVRDFLKEVESVKHVQYVITEHLDTLGSFVSKIESQNNSSVSRVINPKQQFMEPGFEIPINYIIKANPGNIQEVEDLVDKFPNLHFQVHAEHRLPGEPVSQEFIDRMIYLSVAGKDVCIIFDGYVEHIDPTKVELIELCSRKMFYPCFDLNLGVIYQCTSNRENFIELNQENFTQAMLPRNDIVFESKSSCKTCPHINSGMNVRS